MVQRNYVNKLTRDALCLTLKYMEIIVQQLLVLGLNIILKFIFYFLLTYNKYNTLDKNIILYVITNNKPSVYFLSY